MPDWDGGYIRWSRRGRPTYIIHRMVGGRQYEVSTGCHILAAAKKHLIRFESDPPSYRRGGSGREPLRLTQELLDRYLTWSAEHNSPAWVRKQRRYLKWWAGKLGRLDLRRVDLGQQIIPAVNAPDCTVPGHRIAVLKGFYSYLRSTCPKSFPVPTW